MFGASSEGTARVALTSVQRDRRSSATGHSRKPVRPVLPVCPRVRPAMPVAPTHTLGTFAPCGDLAT